MPFRLAKALLHAALVGVVLVCSGTVFPFVVLKFVAFRTAVLAAVGCFLWGLLVASDREYQELGDLARKSLKTPMVTTVSVFVLAFVIAGVLGVNPANSFWSNYERGEGGFQILCLYLFFTLAVLLFRDRQDWLLAFRISLAASLGAILYGILAGLGVDGFLGVPFGLRQRFQGSFGNPLYFSSYLLFSLFFVLYLIQDSHDTRTRRGLGFLAAVLCVFFLLAKSRGPFIGLAAGTTVGLLTLASRMREFRVAILGSVLALVLLGAFLYNVRLSPAMERAGLARLFSVSVDDSSVQSRLWSWREALGAWKERPLLGWGPENYTRLMSSSPTKPAARFDRAHNVYIDYLATTGILGLSAFVAMFVALFRGTLKPRSGRQGASTARALFVGMGVAYLVQGLVTFDTLPVNLSMFLLFGFANLEHA